MYIFQFYYLFRNGEWRLRLNFINCICKITCLTYITTYFTQKTILKTQMDIYLGRYMSVGKTYVIQLKYKYASITIVL